MKISIQVDENIKDTEINISCNTLSSDVEKIIATLRMMDRQLMVLREGETYFLDVSQIVYIEAVERKTFVYTTDYYYESKLKLYEIEEQLCRGGFFRASKSCIVQLRKIKSLKNDVDRKIRLTLDNGEQIMVSRQYADELKKRLGV